MTNYIELMDRVYDAYTLEHIRRYTKSVREEGLTEHGFPRLTANLGILLCHGKRLDLKADFVEMMDLCCDEIPVAHTKRNGVGNDFSVKEMVFCLLELEKSDVIEKSKVAEWREKLSKLVCQKTYDVIAPYPPRIIPNWAAFAGASEQLRKYAGLAAENFFIENQMQSQLFAFDENGMYRDPHEPMVYDFVTRLQLATAVYFGLEGDSREKLVEQFEKSADLTLKMQSVTGEIPFGGRSNQFLHNEAFYAALCEFYAHFYNEKGDVQRAGEFKFAAEKAIGAIVPWLEEDTITHIKNYYPTDSMYGCEDYAYFDKYMVTTASWLYLAHIMAEDITPVEPDDKVYICKTSEHFHKVFLRFEDYFAEFDTKADPHYDGNGLGRIHKKGVSGQLCLATSFAQKPNYKISKENSMPFAICGGKDGVYGSFEDVEYVLKNETVGKDLVSVAFDCLKDGEILFTTECTLSENGVEFAVEGNGEVEILFPGFYFDGKNYTDISAVENKVEITYKGHKCIYTASGTAEDFGETFENRNGVYKAFKVKGNNKVSLKTELI